ncbi:MAG: helix-turn-helix domain-containing protein [Candidatus Sumerlaeota bacterium]|nr:helix-turn-helix domain-containing protein [Candidatus Sumerlaeota bacterium]
MRSLDVDEGRGTILDAWREGDRFVVKSPTFEMLSAPIAGLGLLRNVSPKAIDEFEIDPYGAFVYWPRLDVHLGWDQFEQAANPAAKLRALQMSREFNARYGQAIRRFRESTGLRQCDIPGLDERTVRRVEQGRTRATAGALARLARAHGMNPTDYMARLAELLDRSTPDA